MLFDKFGRPLLKLRVAVNDVCNYSCIFCHFEGQLRGVGRGLAPEDYSFVVDVFRELGVRDFKLTGGEPLLRSDIVDIIRLMRRDDVEISMTTNGYRLAELAPRLASAGLKRVNVSIHSLKPDLYSKVTGAPKEWLDRVVAGVKRAVEYGIGAKLNAVILRGVNTDKESVKSLVKFASSLGANVQFIELMPMGDGARAFGEYYEPAETIVEVLESLGAKPLYTRKDLHNRPIFSIGGVFVEVVKNWNNPYFCAGCTTLRLTSDGKLKPCLYREPLADLYGFIKRRDREGLIGAVKRVVALREPMFKDHSSS